MSQCLVAFYKLDCCFLRSWPDHLTSCLPALNWYTCFHTDVSFWLKLSPAMSVVPPCCLTFLPGWRLAVISDWPVPLHILHTKLSNGRMTQCQPFKSWLVRKKKPQLQLCNPYFSSYLSTAAFTLNSFRHLATSFYHSKDFMVSW